MPDQFDTGVVTVMFTDVEGSTDLTRRLGDEAARRTIESYRRIVRAKLAEHEGREIDSIGDGFMITFLSTRRAVACAVDIHKALEQHAREHPDEEVRVRIGLNVGEVLERGGHPFGAAVNATQRVAAYAKGGQIFVSEPVRHLAGTIPELTFRDRGRRTLKGFPERWRLYEVVWQRPAEKAPPRPKRAPERPAVWWRRRTSVAAAAVVAALLTAAAAFAFLRGGSETLDRVAPNSVGIIDPSSDDIVDEVRVGSNPVDVAFGEGAIWVANLISGTISKVDPDSRELRDTFNAGDKPRGIAAGEGAVWVTNGFDNRLTIFDPTQNEVVDTRDLAGPKDVVVGHGAVWVVNVTDGAVVRIDPETHEPERFEKGRAVAIGDKTVWIADGRRLTGFDPETRREVRRVTLRFEVSQLAVGDDGVVWATHQRDDAVSYVDPDGGSSAIENVANEPTGIAVGEDAVWIANSLGRSLIRIDASSKRVEQRIALGSVPEGVVVAAGRVWVTTQSPSG
jgi:class 3 adenylate cyclase/streptogramin lyase